MATMNKDVQSLIKAATKEIAEYGRNPVVNLDITAQSTVQLIGLLQLVTRHPALPEAQKNFAKTLVENLSKGFKPEHKAIAWLIREGWKQEHDIEVVA